MYVFQYVQKLFTSTNLGLACFCLTPFRGLGQVLLAFAASLQPQSEALFTKNAPTVLHEQSKPSAVAALLQTQIFDLYRLCTCIQKLLTNRTQYKSSICKECTYKAKLCSCFAKALRTNRRFVRKVSTSC